MSLRWGLFLGALVASVLLTALLWRLGVPGFFLFLLFPFFTLAARRPARRCPACGWSPTARDARFCPRDGRPIE